MTQRPQPPRPDPFEPPDSPSSRPSPQGNAPRRKPPSASQNSADRQVRSSSRSGDRKPDRDGSNYHENLQDGDGDQGDRRDREDREDRRDQGSRGNLGNRGDRSNRGNPDDRGYSGDRRNRPNAAKNFDDDRDDRFDDLIAAPRDELRAPETWNDNWRDRDRVPRAPLWRRGYAMSLDFLIASLICALLTNNNWLGQLVTFNFVWLAIRAVVPASNFGQSPGRWAFDIRTVDRRYERTPGVYELLRREAIAGNAAFLAYTGLRALGSLNAFYLLCLMPLAVDVGLAWLEPGKPFAFHDRIAQTVVVVTRRGYSLDLKVKKWVAIALANMKR